MFDENSGLVQTWLRLIKTGVYTYEQVPFISNLRAVLGKILEIEEDS